MALPESFDVVEAPRAQSRQTDELQAANKELAGRIAALERATAKATPKPPREKPQDEK